MLAEWCIIFSSPWLHAQYIKQTVQYISTKPVIVRKFGHKSSCSEVCGESVRSNLVSGVKLYSIAVN